MSRSLLKIFFLRRKKVQAVPKDKVEQARALVLERLKYFNQKYNFEYKKVIIRNQRTRWGSCSSRGNLSFNYRIIYLPKEAQDYLIVHELMHLKEFNHSKNFWKLVEGEIPEYKRISEEMRRGKLGLKIIINTS